MTDLLTHSRMSTYKTCARKHYWAYELAIKPDRDAAPLRIGRAVHLGIEHLANGKSTEDAIQAVCDEYDAASPGFISDEEAVDWLVEREEVVQLIAGYAWRWSEYPLEHVQSEQQFEIPLINPETGRPTPLFMAAGKIDGIVRLADGRLAIKETKTCGEQLDADSDYWKRLRIDQQISLYFMAAKALGHDVQTVLYDVIRKPMIRPKLVNKVRETPSEYGQRLLADIAERPDFYYARREIPRIEADIDEFAFELWQMQQLIRDCQKVGRWPRNTSACLMFGRCPYFQLCTEGYDPATGALPRGYVVGDKHPELKENTNGRTAENLVAAG